MDNLADADVARLWRSVPASDCTSPDGAPATLHGRHGDDIAAHPHLLRVFETAPANTLKLSVHGSPPAGLTPEQEKALQNTTSIVAILYSRVMRHATPLGPGGAGDVPDAAPAGAADGIAAAAAALPALTASTTAEPASAAAVPGSGAVEAPLSASAMATLKAFAEDIKRGGASTLAGATCALRVFGTQYGGHALCTQAHASARRHEYTDHAGTFHMANHTLRCFYINFGIEQDYSFDTELVDALGCSGVALDPTVDHLSELTNNVFFLKMGAPSLANATWQTIDLVRLWEAFARRPVWAVKYDCEGCEYALALADDAAQRTRMTEFFRHAHQFNVEIHLHTFILDTVAKLENLAALLDMLREVGMRFMHFATAGCGRDVPGVRSCRPEVYEAGLPCEGNDCSSFLFAKV